VVRYHPDGVSLKTINYICKKSTVRYFIIGFKNSGKTTLGRKLARMLNMDFIDLDEYIEENEGRSIPEIYTSVGDETFRTLEWKSLKELVKKDNIVVSTGGGVPCHCNNMNLMEKYGEVIYLNVRDETLVNRLKRAVHDRPIVKGKTEQELRTYIADLRSRCEHHYKRAKYIVDGENINLPALLKSMATPSGS
jgi:shikimate kinase